MQVALPYFSQSTSSLLGLFLYFVTSQYLLYQTGCRTLDSIQLLPPFHWRIKVKW